MGDSTGPRARLHPGRGSARRGLGRTLELGIPAGRLSGAASRLLSRPRSAKADHRLRSQVRQELERREPRIREI